MKKEEVISTGVMMLVSILVLIGFTVAWYSAGEGRATVIGMNMVAARTGNIKIALSPGGPDIADLEVQNPGSQYADIGLEELTNIEDGKLAPGAFGKMTFYLTPEEEGVKYCDVLPEVDITGNEELYEIVQRHVEFFSDEAMTKKIDTTEANRLCIVWTDEESQAQEEKEVVIYWKWHYEDPSVTRGHGELTEEEEQKIIAYDEEDTLIGKNVTSMKFHVTFTVN